MFDLFLDVFDCMVIAVDFQSGGPAVKAEINSVFVLLFNLVQNLVPLFDLIEKPELRFLKPD